MNRQNGRGPGEVRPVTFDRGYLNTADGSCMISVGDTRVLCAANMLDGVSAWRRGKGVGWLTAEYSLLPASTHTRTRREAVTGGQVGRTHEIQRLIGRSLRTVVDMGGFGGEYTMAVDCDVIQADGGTRTAAITGAYVAVHDALARWQEAGKISSLPLIDQLVAVSVGMVDGVLLADLDYGEDSAAEIDMNLVMDGQGRFVEVQGTAERVPFERSRLDEMLDIGQKAAAELLALQSACLEGQ